jgi:prevent-host-death family protein
MYVESMDVSITAFRAELAMLIDRVRVAEELVITARGTPVARLPVGSTSLIESLTEQRMLSKPHGPRPVARAAKRSTPTARYRITWQSSGANRFVAIVYFDSSAFLKLIVEEEGSDLAAEHWDRCDGSVSSRLAYPEVRAVIAAAARDQR